MASTSACPEAEFSLRMSEITHVVIQTGYTGRLNEYMLDISRMAEDKYGAKCDCLFTYDGRNMPFLFVSRTTPEREAITKHIQTMIEKRRKTDGIICFDVSGHGFIGFDLIDLLITLRYCSIYSNVSELYYVRDEKYKVLVLTYDSADD